MSWKPTLHKRSHCDCGNRTEINPATGAHYHFAGEAICRRCWLADVKSGGAEVDRGRRDRLLVAPHETPSPLCEWYRVSSFNHHRARVAA